MKLCKVAGKHMKEGITTQGKRRGLKSNEARNGRRWRVYILYICSEGWSFYTLFGSVLELHIELTFTAIYLLFKSLNSHLGSC